jgi:hypothetical protein
MESERAHVQSASRRFYNQLPYLTASYRHQFFYFNDDGDVVSMRYENWKIVFEEQWSPGTMSV